MIITPYMAAMKTAQRCYYGWNCKGWPNNAAVLFWKARARARARHLSGDFFRFKKGFSVERAARVRVADRPAGGHRWEAGE